MEMMTTGSESAARAARKSPKAKSRSSAASATERTRTARVVGAVIGAHLVEDSARAAQIAEVMKALAHPLRIQIVAVLCVEGELHVNALAERLGQKQAIVSQQLRILRMRGLLAVTRADGLARYRVAEPKLREMVRCMEGCSI